MPVPLHCTLTLKLRITQRIIPVYVCVSVCLPACLSIHPFILLPASVCLFCPQLHMIRTSNTYVDSNSLYCLFAAFSLSSANDRSAHKVCLNDPYDVITFVTVSLLSVHNCYCQLQNYIAAKPLSFTLQQHQQSLLSAMLLLQVIILPH